MIVRLRSMDYKKLPKSMIIQNNITETKIPIIGIFTLMLNITRYF